MINTLITDIAYENISLSQALTRAKLIAYQIEDITLQEWIGKELTGYNHSDNKMPEYRIVECKLEGIVIDGLGREYRRPIEAGELNDLLEGNLYSIRINNSISGVEEIINNSTSEQAYEFLAQELVVQMTQIYKLPANNLEFKHISRVMNVLHIKDILTKTKQKLLDILLELHKAFPNLDDNFSPTQSEKAISSQIITTNIYGSNNSSAVGVGEFVNQDVSLQIQQTQIEKISDALRNLGVEESDIEILEATTVETNSSKVKEGVKNWLIELSKKTVEKGIENKLPQIIEAIQSLL